MGLNGQFNARIQRLEKAVEDMPSGTEVPQPSVADYGKVIGVDENGEYSLENVPQEVPTPTEIDGGKILEVNNSGTGYTIANKLFKSGSGSDSIITVQNENVTDYPAVASNNRSFAGGEGTVSSGNCSFAYGRRTSGTNTEARGDSSAAFCAGCIADAQNSFAAGQKTLSKGVMSSSFGNNTIAAGRSSFVIGQYNVEDTEEISDHGTGAHKYLFIVGNGTNANSRSNAMTLDWNGNIVCNNIPAPPTSDGAYQLTCTVNNGVVLYSWAPLVS